MGPCGLPKGGNYLGVVVARLLRVRLGGFVPPPTFAWPTAGPFLAQSMQNPCLVQAGGMRLEKGHQHLEASHRQIV